MKLFTHADESWVEILMTDLRWTSSIADMYRFSHITAAHVGTPIGSNKYCYVRYCLSYRLLQAALPWKFPLRRIHRMRDNTNTLTESLAIAYHAIDYIPDANNSYPNVPDFWIVFPCTHQPLIMSKVAAQLIITEDVPKPHFGLKVDSIL